MQLTSIESSRPNKPNRKTKSPARTNFIRFSKIYSGSIPFPSEKHVISRFFGSIGVLKWHATDTI